MLRCAKHVKEKEKLVAVAVAWAVIADNQHPRSNLKLPVSRNIQHQHVDDLCWIPMVGLRWLVQNRSICIGNFQLDPGKKV